MRLFFAFICLLAGTVAFPRTDITAEEWLAFKAEHGKSYSSLEEEVQRYEIYLKNKQMIEEHNRKFENGEVSYYLALNRFADLNPNEMRRGVKRERPAPPMSSSVHVMSAQALPDAVDWRNTSGVVPDVQYDEDCESSWAFTAIDAMTIQLFMKKNLTFPALSPQNLIDCTYDMGNYGCEGGWIDYAFTYIQQNGIESEENYPYRGYDDTCKFDKSLDVSGATVTGYTSIPTGSEAALMDAVATVGPIVVSVGASDVNFMTYRGGIYNPDNSTCAFPATSPEHNMLLVGYGALNNQSFWIIQNVWGASWGESGYMRLIRTGNNTCGIATHALYPTV